jgi:hypothetical protein
MEQLSVVWHDIQQLVAASEGQLAGASLGGLSAILTSATLNRFALVFVWGFADFPASTLQSFCRSRSPSLQSSGHSVSRPWRGLRDNFQFSGGGPAALTRVIVFGFRGCKICC